MDVHFKPSASWWSTTNNKTFYWNLYFNIQPFRCCFLLQLICFEIFIGFTWDVFVLISHSNIRYTRYVNSIVLWVFQFTEISWADPCSNAVDWWHSAATFIDKLFLITIVVLNIQNAIILTFLASREILRYSNSFLLYVSHQSDISTAFLRRRNGVCPQVVCSYVRTCVRLQVLHEVYDYVLRTNGWA